MNEPNEGEVYFPEEPQDSLDQADLNVYHAAYDYVSNLVTAEGQIRQVFPFTPGYIDTDAAFAVLSEKIATIFSDDPEESYSAATNVVCLAFMAGAWIASLDSQPSGYTISLTQEQITQVVHTWVDNSLGKESL